MKNVSTSSDPSTSSTAPTSAQVAIPSFKMSEAETTNTAVPNSLITARRSTAFIFSASPFMYSVSALQLFKSRTDSMHSCMPSAQAILASIDLRDSPSCAFALSQTMAKDTGSTHRQARPMRQSKHSRLTATSSVETIDPANSGI